VSQGDTTILRPKISITGLPGAGKTATILRVAEMVKGDFTIGGYTTHPILEEQEVVHGFGTTHDEVKVAIRLIAYDNQDEAIVARKDLDTKFKIQELGVDLDAIEEVAVPAMRRAMENCDLILVDEVGKLGSDSKLYAETLKELLEMNVSMLLTMHKRSRNPLLQDLRRRDDIRVLEVTPINAGLLPHKIVRILRGEVV